MRLRPIGGRRQRCRRRSRAQTQQRSLILVLLLLTATTCATQQQVAAFAISQTPLALALQTPPTRTHAWKCAAAAARRHHHGQRTSVHVNNCPGKARTSLAALSPSEIAAIQTAAAAAAAQTAGQLQGASPLDFTDASANANAASSAIYGNNANYANYANYASSIHVWQHAQHASRYIAPLLSSLITYVALAAYYDRPQGTLAVSDDILIAQPSQVTGAGLGLYTTQSLPEGTELGTYPGVERDANSYLNKYSAYPQCGTYAWRFTDNKSYLDPTDAQGNLLPTCYGGSTLVPGSVQLHETLLQPMGKRTVLARINEPPIGGPGCNVRSREDLERRTVTFYTGRDVCEGEELFMDYGLTYDRSAYGGDQ